MSEQTKDDALKEMASFIDVNRKVSVNGELFEIAKLRPIDLAAAREHVVQLRIERFVETTRYMPLEPVIMAKAMAEIECAPLSLFDVMQDPDGRIKLIHLSLTRAGKTIGIKAFREGLDPTMQDELFAYVMWVSGCVPEPTLDASKTDPTETPTDTTVSAGT